jgi:hypothetical protein
MPWSMLVITDAQLKLVDAAVRDRFLARLHEKIRWVFSGHPTSSISSERLLEILRTLVARAEAYGLDRDYDIAVFATLDLANHEFSGEKVSDYLAWAEPILEKTASSGETKMMLVEHMLRRLSASDTTAAALSTACTRMREAYYAEEHG